MCSQLYEYQLFYNDLEMSERYNILQNIIFSNIFAFTVTIRPISLQIPITVIPKK